MINDSEISRQAEENFKQYQQACRDNIKREAEALAVWSREQIALLPTHYAQTSGGSAMPIVGVRHD